LAFANHQEPSAPPKAAGTVPVAAPKGKVAAKSVSFGARSKAKSSPGGDMKRNWEKQMMDMMLANGPSQMDQNGTCIK